MNYKYKNILTAVDFAKDVARQSLLAITNSHINHQKNQPLAITGVAS